VVITKIDSVGVVGTFSGKLSDGSGASKTITNGKFSAPLKKATATPPPTNDSGKVVVWASAGCAASASGPLTVKISTKTGTISSFVSTEPACGATGSANFTLPVGTYTWKAFCGTTDSISGLVTVTANGCTKVKADFTVPPTNCKISKWLEYDVVTGKPEWAYVNTYGATGTNPTKFEWYDSAAGRLMTPPFNFVYTTGKITVDASKNQYFVTGADGKVTEFWGYSDPAYDTTDKVVVKYTYNAAGQLIKRTEATQATPTTVDFVYDYTYTSGNLTKVTVKDGVTTALLADVVYAYSTGETVKSFLALFPASFEIMYFSKLLILARPSSTAKLTQATTTIYIPTTKTGVTNFTNYVIDPTTRQVKSFDVSGSDFGVLGLYNGYRYRLEYKCF
jgi:YD repeat-containing protein